MEFKNNSNDKVKVLADAEKKTWKTVSPGDTVFLPEHYGKRLGLTAMEAKAFESKAGTKKVETKIKKTRKRRKK